MPYKDITKKREYCRKYSKEYYKQNRVERLALEKEERRKKALENPNYVGKTVGCKICDNTFVSKAGGHIYCDNCAYERKLERMRRYTRNNGFKTKARGLSKYHVPKKSNCEICGSTDRPQRHHWRYDRPLLVNTLCHFCHRVQHYKNVNNIPLLEEKGEITCIPQ